MGAPPLVRVVEAVDVVGITLAHPPSNVLTLAMLGELREALEDAAERPALKALSLTAEGDMFCAGLDVGERLAGGRAIVDAFVAVFRALRTVPCPTVAAVGGRALGAGAELATGCDVVVASDEATLGLSEIGLGVFSPVAALHYPLRVGPARALRLILRGEILAAADAERIGLVDRVVAPGALAEALERELGRFRALSAAVLRLTKHALRATHGVPFDEGLSLLEEFHRHHLMTTADAEEGLRAFVDQRKPIWRDR